MGFWQFATGGGSGGGTGDVVGPASSTDNAVARWDLATGKLLQNSAMIVADTTGDISWNGDTGLARSAAGVVKVTDGGAGLGKLILSGSGTPNLVFGGVAATDVGFKKGDALSDTKPNITVLTGDNSASASITASMGYASAGWYGGNLGIGTYFSDASTLLNSSGILLGSGEIVAWTSAATPAGSSYNGDLSLTRIAAGQAAVSNATNGMANNIKIATTTVNASGATSTASNLVPAGCILLGVTTRVTTAITSGDGGTSVNIGNGTDADMYGAAIAFALGTTTNLSNHTASALAFKSAAESVVFTCVGGTFNGGVWRVCAHYLDLTAPTS